MQEKLGVEPPLFIMLSLIGVRGYVMAVNHRLYLYDREHPIDRDVLVIPEIILDSYEFDATRVMKPLFDPVWNAAGWPRSMNYDEKGEWVVK